jgi:hypothetical protein
LLFLALIDRSRYILLTFMFLISLHPLPVYSQDFTISDEEAIILHHLNPDSLLLQRGIAFGKSLWESDDSAIAISNVRRYGVDGDISILTYPGGGIREITWMCLERGADTLFTKIRKDFGHRYGKAEKFDTNTYLYYTKKRLYATVSRGKNAVATTLKP